MKGSFRPGAKTLGILLLSALLLGILGAGSCSGVSGLSLREFAKDTDAPMSLLERLEKQIPPEFPPGSYAAAYEGWEGYFCLLPPREKDDLPNPPAALGRAETACYERALQKTLEEYGFFRNLRYPSLGTTALLQVRRKLLIALESAPGSWHRGGFLEDMPWSLLLLPPGNLSVTSLSQELPPVEEILPVYRDICLREGRRLRREGTPEQALPYYREWLSQSPLGPSTASLLEYAEVLLENGDAQEARDLLEKTARQRRNALTEEEVYAIRSLWQRTYPTPMPSEEH